MYAKYFQDFRHVLDVAIDACEIARGEITPRSFVRVEYLCPRIVRGNCVATRLRVQHSFRRYIARGGLAISDRHEISQPAALRTFSHHSHRGNSIWRRHERNE